MKRLVLGLVVILFSIQAIGCDSGGGSSTVTPAPAAGPSAPGSPAAGSPAAGSSAKKGRIDSKVASGLANPQGPKNDR